MDKNEERKLSIRDLVIEFFEAHPYEDMPHSPVVDWVEERYKLLYGKKPRDTWRAIRHLHEEGFLIKVKKGIYRYDPLAAKHREIEDFTPEQKEFILKRDGYKCVRCGKGIAEGVELHVDHIKPKYAGGKSTIENGQTLCSQHNFLKKTMNQTETGKMMFIRLYELAKSEGNKFWENFCKDILRVYEKHNVNSHIKWEE